MRKLRIFHKDEGWPGGTTLSFTKGVVLGEETTPLAELRDAPPFAPSYRLFQNQRQ